MKLTIEEHIVRDLRRVLAPLAVGSPIDHDRHFEASLERFLPSVLAEKNGWWNGNSMDGFQFSVARKVGPEEAEFIGLCWLLKDQSLVPFYLRIRVSAHEDRVEWLDLKVGQAGDGRGNMEEHTESRAMKLLHLAPMRLETFPWAYAITRGAPGDND